jgi:2,4-diaminopentanoate dehydrogenase
MATRVIQWATGAVGASTLKAIIEHPDLELVGVWVHTPEKVGKDAGELVGLPPTGVLATNDAQALIALAADVVVHTPAGQGPIDERDQIVLDLLRSGKNVVSSTGPWYAPELRSHEYRQRIEDACREGGTTLMSAGANPDVVVPWLGAAMTRMSLDVEHIYMAEIDDFSPNPNLNMMVELLGLGKPAEEFEPWMEEGGYFQQSVLEWLHLLARNINVRLGEVVGSYKLFLATRDFNIPVGKIKKDTVCGAAFKWSAPRESESKPFIDFEFIYTVQRDHPNFPGLPNEVRLVVEIEGAPSSRTTIDLAPSFSGKGRDRDAWPSSGVFLAAAASVFNCIPVVLKAPPGLFTMPVPGAWQARSKK